MAGEKILIVDDERHIVRLVQVNLERAGFTTVAAYNGVEALEQVAKENPDLVLLDVMMPRKDGFETLKELQSNDDTKDIPVIMLTAKAQDADIMKGWSSGVWAYLTKPFNPRELLTFVDRVLQGKAEQDNGQIEDGEVWEM